MIGVKERQKQKQSELPQFTIPMVRIQHTKQKGEGRKEEITGEAKTWLISVACQKNIDLGYAAET